MLSSRRSNGCRSVGRPACHDLVQIDHFKCCSSWDEQILEGRASEIQLESNHICAYANLNVRGLKRTTQQTVADRETIVSMFFFQNVRKLFAFCRF